MSQSLYYQTFRNQLQNLVPLLLILICPPAVILFWYTNMSLNGSLSELWNLFSQEGFFPVLVNAWSPIFFGTPEAWKILGIFSAVQLLFMKVVPGETFYGPITPKGNVPIYKANGVQSYFLTLALFVLCSFYYELFPATIIYDNFGGILGALNIFSLFFCLFLYFKGLYAPSSDDNGSTGNPLFDYYWGTELYPRIAGWDIKMFTNCRFALMSWPLILLSFAAKQHELYGLSDSMCVAVALQFIYVTKFFFWETGYLRSLDIMHDRAGYYICWGCLVWVPGFYTSPTLYLVNHPNHLGWPLAAAIFVAGAICILINYFADRQRQIARATQGNCLIWGKKPNVTWVDFITDRGEKKKSLLLTSGWWGLSRHFHYIPEIMGAFFWSVPALFDNFLPYAYVIFLTVLLLDRAQRDDKRCAQKYGAGWKNYCEQVPYKILPYIV